MAADTPAQPSLGDMMASKSGYVVALNGGRGFVSRLATLGFVPGARISMVQNYGHGPLIVLVQQARVALGRCEAARILVQMENQT
jgi:ferrous iron transport protein A